MADLEWTFEKGWGSDFDVLNCPPGVYLRGDNLVRDVPGVVTVRPGSRRLGSKMDFGVNNLRTGYINGVRNRLAVAGTKIYVNDAVKYSSLVGSGDAAVDDYRSNIFVARSTSRVRWDGTSILQWGIDAPLAGQVVASSTGQVSVSTFDSTESPAWTALNGTKANANGSDGSANGSQELTPKNGLATIKLVPSSPLALSSVGGNPQDPADLFNIDFWIADPTTAKSLTLVFGMGTEKDPFLKDRYEYVFQINGTPLPQIPGITPIDDKIGEYDVTPAQKQDAAARSKVKQKKSTTGGTKSDGSTGDDGWFNVGVPRSAFSRVGSGAGRNWGTITAIKLVYRSTSGAAHVRFDNLVLIGGSKSFFGTYRVKLARVRDTSGGWTEQSPVSPASDPVVLSNDNMSVTVPFADVNAATDPITGFDRYAVFLQGGQLDRYYKVGEAQTKPGNSMRIDEFSKASFIDKKFDKAERTRFVSVGFSNPQLPVSLDAAGNLTVRILCDEVKVLIDNIVMVDGVRCPTTAIMTANHLDRQFVLTTTQLLYSPVGQPGLFLSVNALTVGDGTEIPYWVAKTRGGLYVGTNKDIIRVEGDGTESPDGSVNFSLNRLHMASTPNGNGFCVDGNLIFYQSEVGYRIFDGESSVPLPMGNNSALWAGFDRHGIQAVANAGRHRAAVLNNRLYAVVPEGPASFDLDYEGRKIGMRMDEFAVHPYLNSTFDAAARSRWVNVGFTIPAGGSSPTIWRTLLSQGNNLLSPPEPQWDRLTYAPSFTCIIREPDGTLIAGAADGYIYSLYHPGRGDHTDAEVDQFVTLDDKPTIRLKTGAVVPSIWSDNVVVELDAHVQVPQGTGGVTAVSSGGVYKNVLALIDSLSSWTGAAGISIIRTPISFALSIAKSIHWDITFTALGLLIYKFSVNLMPRAKGRLRCDTGYFALNKGDLATLREFRTVVRNTGTSLNYDLYVDETLLVSGGVITTTGSAMLPYTIPVPRIGGVGYQARLVLYNTNPLEVYSVEYAYESTGNQDDLIRQQVTLS